MPQGFRLHMKYYLDGADDDNKDVKNLHRSIIVGKDATFKDVETRLHKFTNTTYNTQTYALNLQSIAFIIAPTSDVGGCSDGFCNMTDSFHSNDPTYQEKKEFMRLKKKKLEGFISVSSYDSTNNNCIFAVFNEFYGVKGNVLKPSVVRQELKIPEGTKVHYSLIP